MVASDRLSLADALAERVGLVPVPSFPAWLDGCEVEVTAVLERTAVCCPPGGERLLKRHDALLVDPAAVTWRRATTGPRFVGPGLKDSGQARALRDGSDSRAREDQARRGDQPTPEPPPDPWVPDLAALLATARRTHDELRDEASAYELALRAARSGRRPPDPPPTRDRRPAPWPPAPTTSEALAVELVRVYALLDDLGQRVVERRRSLRVLHRADVGESAAASA